MYYDKINNVEISNIHGVKVARGNISFPSNVTEGMLNSLGIFSVTIKSEPRTCGSIHPMLGELQVSDSGKYYKEWFVNTTDVEVLECMKEEKLRDLIGRIELLGYEPLYIPELGYAVNCGRMSKDDFKSLWDVMEKDEVTKVRTFDNQMINNVSRDDIAIIWKAIITFWRDLYTYKWGTQAQIDKCGSIQELDEIIIK